MIYDHIHILIFNKPLKQNSLAEKEVEEVLVDLSQGHKGMNETAKYDMREREHTKSIPTVTVTPPEHHADDGFRDSTGQTASGAGKAYRVLHINLYMSNYFL